jgi:acetyltransferase-like isoleucine patch superfamily enzyme
MIKFIRFLLRIIANCIRKIKITVYRLCGVKIGTNTMISLGAKIDIHKGNVIIGDNCLITHGVKIIAHDGSLRLTDPFSDRSGTVIIGNNVFVGVNSIILRNVTIGDNCIIAAGSVVVKDVPSASVVAGNPARIIRSLPGPFHILNNPN